MKYDVFISYHGGGINSVDTSYGKALELYNYLESRGLKCFLYKKVNNEDFYDAINDGLLGSKHFILVACNKNMLSEWVRDEVKQFDGLRKNGKKPNCLISAYIFGSICEHDLYEFNTLFTTKDIVKGEDGFERLYRLILAKNEISAAEEKEEPPLPTIEASENKARFRSFDEMSEYFLNKKLKGFPSFSDGETERHCKTVTKRLKCMTYEVVSADCADYVSDTVNRITENYAANPANPYLMKVIGQSGTQKSYLLQMLYVVFKRHYDSIPFYPVYIDCDKIRDECILNGGAGNIVADMFSGLKTDETRTPLFIIDGLLNVVTDDFRLDYLIKNEIDKFTKPAFIAGINNVFGDNRIRLNKSSLIKGKYEIVLTLSLISIYEKNKCLDYISTLENLPTDKEETYAILEKSKITSINENVIRILCNEDAYSNLNLMDMFESEILNRLGGNEDLLSEGADIVFEFAYGSDDLDFSGDTLTILNLIGKEQMFLHFFVAVKYFNKLSKYETTHDLSFFQMVFSKEITRFITSRLNAYPQYEEAILSLASRYDEMTLMGKSEISYLLGRIKTPNRRPRAIELLRKYYVETQDYITQRKIDLKYKEIPYPEEEYKQDLFLFRGLSVSLIYCSDATIEKNYVRSLIENDLSNSINRGFHLEYYGDKRYLPNQNMLDYTDNPRIGERTLKILCNDVEIQLKKRKFAPSAMLEVFTIVSLLQVRIETDRKLISFNVKSYVERACKIVSDYLNAVTIDDNIIDSFFRMALTDFNNYLENDSGSFSPKRSISNSYLAAKDVKRAGWVMQNIPSPESIVEHMYACWFIGLVFLPLENSEIKGYNKQQILNMLIVHDLAETTLKDIPKYEKVNYPDYEKTENHVMLSVLLKGTYGSIDCMTDYADAWDEWYAMQTENARIAKDIDVIQAIYQFFVYNNSYSGNFSEERRRNWLNELFCIKTETGRRIAKELIIENELFSTVLREYDDIIADFDI